MIDAFYINLDSRTDRHENIEKQLSALGLKAQRISASVGRELTKEQMSFVNFEDFYCLMKRPISSGEIGCALSHRRVWHSIVEQDINYALILEDDVTIDKRLIELLKKDSFYSNYDFINLSTTEPYTFNKKVIDTLLSQGVTVRPKDKRLLQLWKSLEWRNKWNIFKLNPLNEDLVICECDPAPALASGYIISKKAAQNFLDTSKSLYIPIDYIWRYSPGELRQAFLSEPLVIQTHSDSDILNREQTHKLTLRQKLRRTRLKKMRNDRRNDVKTLYGKI